MSNSAINWARHIQGIQSSEKSVLICLADYFNDELLMAWPSVKTISGFTCLHPRTVQRALRGLEEKGLIESRPVYFTNQEKQGSNQYVFPDFAKPQGWQPNAWAVRTGSFDFLGWQEEDY